MRLFVGFDASGQRLFALVLRRLGGAFSLQGRRRDDGSRTDTGFFGIGDAPHFVEVDWQRSSAPGVDDGSFTLSIDGVPSSALAGVDNDLGGVAFVRMGAISVKTGASGTLLFDQFESRRDRPIGPE